MLHHIVLILGLMIVQTKGDCEPPPVVSNGSSNITTGSSFEEGTVIVYECGFAFVTSGWPYYTCQNSSWSNPGRPIYCYWKSCRFPEIAHCSYELTSNTVGNVANFTCDEGYTMQGHHRSICLANEEWDSLPSCHVVHCPNVHEGSHIIHRPYYNNGDRNSYDSYINSECDNGLYVLRGTSHRRCQGDGTWSGDDAFCERRGCGVPDVGHGTVEDLTNYYLFDMGTVICNSGSVRHGPDWIECLEGGWTDTYCYKDCPQPSIEHGYVRSDGLVHGDALDWSCNHANYVKSTYDVITCNDGNFTQTPACVPITFGHDSCLSETTDLSTSRYQDACYLFIRSSTTYEQARTGCEHYGGDLVQYYEDDVMGFVSNALTILQMTSIKMWIGMKWTDDQWKWNDGTPVSPVSSHWLPTEGGKRFVWFWKSEECAVMKKKDGRWGWADTDCDDSDHGYICQVTPLV